MQCRACLKTKCSILINMTVAATDEGLTLFDYFNDCTQLHASASDSLPKTLCKICTKKLRIAYSFRKCALESNDMFVKILTLQTVNTQSTVNSVVNSDDYADNLLEIEFGDALQDVKTPYREQPFVDESYNKMSSFEDEYEYEIPLINETIVVEQSQTSCQHNNHPQENIRENSYDENSCNGVEEIAIDTLDYIEDDSQEHIKRKYEKGNENNFTCGFDMPYDDEAQIKKYIKSERNNLNTEIDETDRIDIEIATPESCCIYCKEIYSSDVELQGHVKKHLFKCHICSKICTDVSKYYRHIKRLHNRLETEAPASQAVIEGVEINEDKCIYCKTCKVAYSTMDAYKRHLSRKHDFENSDAKILCGDIQTVKYKVCCAQKDVHKNISYVEEDVKNIYCSENECEINENVTEENNLAIKIRSCTQNDRITQISSEESTQERIDNHKLKEKEKFLCSFCPRVLSSKRGLEIHEGKQHLNIGPDLKECSFCQKKFDKVYLRKHIENVHIGERKFKCDICGNMYKTNDNVMRHRLLHTKDRNYPCTMCDKRFTEKSELKVHMRIHTGEKPFACHLCDRRFRIRVHLTYHLQQHSRIKHKCTVCGKEFKHGKSLRNHMYLHTDVMPYRCSICGYGSVKRDYFVKHMLHKHDKTMTVDELFVIFQENTGRSPYVKIIDHIDMHDENTEGMETAN